MYYLVQYKLKLTTETKSAEQPPLTTPEIHRIKYQANHVGYLRGSLSKTILLKSIRLSFNKMGADLNDT